MEETRWNAAPDTIGRRLAFPAASPAEAAHLAAFWPECQPAPAARAELLALPLDAPPPLRAPGQLLRYAAGPLRSPAFQGRHRAVALLPLPGLPPCLHEVPLAAAPDAGPEALARAEAFAARLVAARLGGEPGLPDPGFARLGLPRRAALLVLDPCRPDRAAAARAALAAAEAAAGGRPLLLARDPAAPAEAAFQLRPPAGARLLRARLAPWTLLDLAEDLYGAGPEMALLAAAAGVRVAGRMLPAAPRWAALLAHLRCVDPFLSRPWSAEQALDQLAQWQQAQAENRRVAVCLGMAFWKRDRIAALFAHAGGAPAFARRPARALAEAQARHGAIAAWAGAIPAGFRAECAAAGVPLLTVEDGFVRSRGLGARFLPGAAYAVDERGVYYDPSRESALEHLLAITEFSPDLLRRAADLRAAIVRRGVTKYNLHGEAPVIAAPAGRKKLLVPGQVEDDASVRLGGGAIQGNRALLQAVRDAHPEAWLVYKPHPDLEAGFRKGRLPPEALAGLADQVVTGAPLTALFPQIDALHTLTSLSGFEALLRGVPVVTWGQPFYAGWGLTEDRAPALPRRGRPLSLDALVAATLILFPRQVDPLTELPCPPELILERLDDPSVWKVSRWTAHRGLEGWIRGLLARRKGLR
ncbi:capsular polysaccharide export protein, LipB/KpsS family [Roseomonas sp. USHLN139]|uniref:capsular polysaccharide export protein, LipB/KpsS family n=1 Tax=Roseomonas sp. USHLN139 TaxID=3081298 RepID=UPI003B01E4CF